jgi:hypothetical protein
LGGYETWRATSSFLEVEASRKIVSTLAELLAKVSKWQTTPASVLRR